MNNKQEKLIREYVRMKIGETLNENKQQQKNILIEEG